MSATKQPKRRSRWRTAGKVMLVVLAIPLAAYGYLYWRLHRHPVVVSRKYTAEINEKILATPPTDRAWPLYRVGLMKLKWHLSFSTFHPIAAQEWPKLVAYLQRHQAELELFRTASIMPRLGCPLYYFDNLPAEEVELNQAIRGKSSSEDQRTPSTDPITSNEPLAAMAPPSTYLLRQVDRLLMADAFHALENGDGHRAGESLKARLRIVRQIREFPTALDEIMSAGMLRSIYVDVIESIVQYPEIIADEDLTAIARLLSDEDFELPIEYGEWEFMDFVQRIYTDDGAGNGVVSIRNPWVQSLDNGDDEPWWAALMEPILTYSIASRRDTVEQFQELNLLVKEEVRAPLWKNASLRFVEARKRLDSKKHPAFLIALGWERAYFMSEQTRQLRDATLAVIALERFRRAQGGWPTRLEQLVPDYLEELPIDRFDGQPLRYRHIDGKPLLYSVGTNRIDDDGYPFGGDEFNQETVKRFSECPWNWDGSEDEPLERGDFVFLPPPPRVPPSEPEEFTDELLGAAR